MIMRAPHFGARLALNDASKIRQLSVHLAPAGKWQEN
jgi:hypothetical protein